VEEEPPIPDSLIKEKEYRAYLYKEFLEAQKEYDVSQKKLKMKRVKAVVMAPKGELQGGF
jgi:hypothetical protein